MLNIWQLKFLLESRPHREHMGKPLLISGFFISNTFIFTTFAQQPSKLIVYYMA